MKSYAVEILPSAIDDLFEIWLFIAEDNVTQADKWQALLLDQTHSLSDFPEMGRPYKGPYRMLVADNGY